MVKLNQGLICLRILFEGLLGNFKVLETIEYFTVRLLHCIYRTSIIGSNIIKSMNNLLQLNIAFVIISNLIQKTTTKIKYSEILLM